MAITGTAHTKVKTYVKNLIKEGSYIIGGVTKTTPVFKMLQEGDQLTVYFYLNDSVAGSITKFQVIDVDGEVLDDQPDSMTKKEINGLLVAFRFSIKLQ
ncbi:hypothetical protein [Niallia taxi]|uniref:hypothetical protein n=1 Tax=Niallia taxi TaxID=2499688 RepID=UPI003008FB45